MSNEPNPPSYQIPPPPSSNGNGGGGGQPPQPRLTPQFTPQPPKRGLNGCLVAFLVTLFVGGGGVMLIMLALVASSVAGAQGSTDLQIQKVTEIEGDLKNVVVIIPITGVIQSGVGGGGSSSDTMIQLIRAAGEDPNVKVIVFDMNTPGGEVTATDEVYHEIQKLRERSENPIKFITCMRSVAASGGYYLAAGTDHIVANRLTMTGSIGVMIGGMNYHKLLNEKLGVEAEVYKSGRLKDILNPARERDDFEATVIQDMVEESYAEFQKIVAKGRNITREKIDATPEIRDARILSGAQALELGLVDELGYLEDAVAKAQSMIGVPNAMVQRYDQRPSLMDTLLYGKANAKPPQSLVDQLAGENPHVQKGQLYFLAPTSY